MSALSNLKKHTISKILKLSLSYCPSKQDHPTSAFQAGGELFQEMDVYIDETRKRRPDLAYFTTEQIDAMRSGVYQPPK